MGKISWYWHRLRAMHAGEVLAHARKSWRQRRDCWGLPSWSGLSVDSLKREAFPRLPMRERALDALRASLAQDAVEILGGRWKAFGWLPLQVDSPPGWHKDYLAGADLMSEEWGCRLDHRAQPFGADIKVIWEPSRWNQLVRLAQAAWLLEHESAAKTCIQWLDDWARHNAPFRGLNWTSALETGIRLIQLAWIDALLAESDSTGGDEWRRLRAERLPAWVAAHVHYTWHYRSFGSSANNHLIGELAGLMVAAARWPRLVGHWVDLSALQPEWEREVLLQFAPDGGNREQALAYHWFSWEFCWQAMAALRQSGRQVAPEVRTRLERAISFFAILKAGNDPWDFGDSDNAWVTPFFQSEEGAAAEWQRWAESPESSPSIDFWWREDRPASVSRSSPNSNRAWFRDSGYVHWRDGDWELRWDLSELGYLATAAHGHLDALHLSIRYQGEPFLIDPGTGAYYADRVVRDYLASWDAHNAPHPHGWLMPPRRGTFLWGYPHPPQPRVIEESSNHLVAELSYGGFKLRRCLSRCGGAWLIDDAVEQLHGAKEPSGLTEGVVCWRLDPAWELARRPPSDSEFTATHGDGTRRLRVACEAGHARIEYFNPNDEQRQQSACRIADFGNPSLKAICSPRFRQLRWAPFVAVFLPLSGVVHWRTKICTDS